MTPWLVWCKLPSVIMNETRNLGRRIIAAILGVVLMDGAVRAAVPTPSIIITNLPAYGSTTSNLSGYIQNADPTTNAVIVFIYVAGAWYSKPSCASQLTSIQADGSWTADITTSSSDKTATEIAAFLVPANYNLPCVNGDSALNIPTQALAVVYANRSNPSARQFNFSGYHWWVRTSAGNLAGPGPNYFSDSTNNAWLDAQGALHLKITYTNSTWQCVEVISERNFGYGQYRFTVNAPVNTLDASAVLGLFTWSNDSAYNDREIDVEFSRWNYAFGTNYVGDYAVSPYNPGQVLRLSLPAGITNSTHSFIWQSNNVAFQGLDGNFDPAPPAGNILQTWSCSHGIPPAGGEQVHINLWLNKGNPPVNGQPVEVVISNFTYVPLGLPPPAQLGQPTGLPESPVQLRLDGQSDWHYQMQVSSNLSNWTPIGTILATNSSISCYSLPTLLQFSDSNPASLSPRFYRALTEP